MSQKILVFPRNLIDCYNGFYALDKCYDLIEKIQCSYQWIERSVAEESNDLIQAIPCVFLYNDLYEYVVFESINNEKSYLNEKYSLLVGGHIDYICDVSLHDILENTLRREIHEEIIISDEGIITKTGIIIDKSSIERSKHICFLYNMNIVQHDITIKSYDEFKDGINYYTNKLLYKNRYKFDPWSQIIINRIIDY